MDCALPVETHFATVAPAGIKSIAGGQKTPQLTTLMSQFRSLAQARVITTGAITPAGDLGISTGLFTLPRTSNSASAVGVKRLNSGVLPAADTPGTSLVSVLAMQRMNVPRHFILETLLQILSAAPCSSW